MSKNFPQNHDASGLFTENCSGMRLKDFVIVFPFIEMFVFVSIQSHHILISLNSDITHLEHRNRRIRVSIKISRWTTTECLNHSLLGVN